PGQPARGPERQPARPPAAECKNDRVPRVEGFNSGGTAYRAGQLPLGACHPPGVGECSTVMLLSTLTGVVRDICDRRKESGMSVFEQKSISKDEVVLAVNGSLTGKRQTSFKDRW